jgi:hypothetical protein
VDRPPAFAKASARQADKHGFLRELREFARKFWGKLAAKEHKEHKKQRYLNFRFEISKGIDTDKHNSLTKNLSQFAKA